MSRDNARAFWITGPGTGELRHADLAEPGPGEVEVETLYTAISRGTETLVFSGSVPSEETARMRAPFQEGDFPAPVKYGYINVGRVTRGVEELVDRDVFCLYPHQTRFVVPADAVTLIPDDVPAARAVLAANLETAVNGIIDRVKGWVADSSGTADKVDMWGKRRMAYSIRKQREANYVLFNLTMPPSTTSGLEKNLRYTETIMRHMLTLVI